MDEISVVRRLMILETLFVLGNPPPHALNSGSILRRPLPGKCPLLSHVGYTGYRLNFLIRPFFFPTKPLATLVQKRTFEPAVWTIRKAGLLLCCKVRSWWDRGGLRSHNERVRFNGINSPVRVGSQRGKRSKKNCSQ